MEISECKHLAALRLSSQMLELEYDCPKKCSTGKLCRMRFGICIATYSQHFNGQLKYQLLTGAGIQAGQWNSISDNEEMFVEHSGFCSGKVVLKLQCLGGTSAIWLTDGKNGIPVSVNGRPVGKSTFSFSCTEGKEPDKTNVLHRGLNIGGMVHTLNIHGGVRRYLELGNAFASGGNNYHLFVHTLQEKSPWLGFKGVQHPYHEYAEQRLDIAFTGAYEGFRDLLLSNSDKKVVMVVAKFYADKYLQLWREKGNALKWIGVASDWNKGMEEISGTCIAGGVNTKFFTPVFPVQKHKPVIAFYARTGDGRGIERILGLAKILWSEATFVGFDAPDYPTMSGNLPSNMSIVQTPTQEALRTVLQSADIVVSCMRSAGWNNVIAEGSSCGCVPIANDAGTKDVILHGRTGFVCGSQWFEKEAAEYIRHLAANWDIMDRMARRANAWVRQFDWDIVAEKIITEVYK